MIQKLLLVADDNEDNRIVFQAVLQHAGYAVLLAVDGSEVLSQARAHTPALVVLDLMMPNVTGWEALAQLRADPVTEDIPVLAASADTNASATELERAGFCGFVPKPILPAQLVQAVKHCLEEVGEGRTWVDLRTYGMPTS